ncbi:MAG: hypothetical protein HON42_03475 [Alphaproteobacteria bacterium]|jgi:hypothetical protein|nr:hypothetical protein [Alphaproteobacteria bacterium]MBT5827279.1 hypothetical protein [Alphaproteobacteria bacterium]
MLNKIIRLTILLILTQQIVACDPTRNNIFAPNKRLLKKYPKNAGYFPDYKQGWLDGCETGMATGFANDYYKLFYKFQKDREMVKKGVKPYLRAWSSAMIYCRHFVTATLKEAQMTPKLPGQGFSLPLGGDKGDGDLPAAGHGILNVWDLKNQGAIGLSKW